MLSLALDAILVLVVVEAIALTVYHRRTGRGVAPPRLVATLAAGFFLMLALRFAIAQAGDGPVAGPVGACLLASLVAHIADLAGRWRG